MTGLYSCPLSCTKGKQFVIKLPLGLQNLGCLRIYPFSDSPELVGNVAQPPPDVVGDVLGHVVNVADGGEALGQAEAPDRVHYVILQSLLRRRRPFLRIHFT